MSRLVASAAAAGVEVCCVREPGGTQVGERIRTILLDPSSEMSLHCEMLLYMASRAQLVEEKIRPGLAAGALVIADRFVSSTYAYQGTAGGVDLGAIRAVADAAVRGTYPDVVLIFDVDATTAAKRTTGVERGGKKRTGAKEAAGREVAAGDGGSAGGARETGSLFADRIEQRGRSFHAKVRAGYLELAKAEPGRHIVIDGSASAEVVWAEMVKRLWVWVGAQKRAGV